MSLPDPAKVCRFAPDGHFAVGTTGGQVRVYTSTYTQKWSKNAGG